MINILKYLKYCKFCIFLQLFSNHYRNDEISSCPNAFSGCRMPSVLMVFYYEAVLGHG